MMFKTKALKLRYISASGWQQKRATEIVLYSMHFAKSSKRIVWRLIGRFGPFKHSSIAIKEIQRLAERHNAHNFWWDTRVKNNAEVNIEDPLEFFLICMRLQKEQGDEN